MLLSTLWVVIWYFLVVTVVTSYRAILVNKSNIYMFFKVKLLFISFNLLKREKMRVESSLSTVPHFLPYLPNGDKWGLKVGTFQKSLRLSTRCYWLCCKKPLETEDKQTWNWWKTNMGSHLLRLDPPWLLEFETSPPPPPPPIASDGTSSPPQWSASSDDPLMLWTPLASCAHHLDMPMTIMPPPANGGAPPTHTASSIAN